MFRNQRKLRKAAFGDAMNIIDKKLKLVIWDMDDTFWQGTISEGSVKCPTEHQKLLKKLVDNGIMNSICSNNDFEVVQKQLESLGLWEYFVFPQISWQRKGPAIEKIITDAQLRPDNTLFVDDRMLNLEEARFRLPELMVLDATKMSVLEEYLEANLSPDPEHTRLERYKLLEKKAEVRTEMGSDKDFLQQSDIAIALVSVRPHLARIAELIERTNQLNFTKKRISQTELEQLLEQPDVTCKAIRVKDKYGDYGISGFYALRQTNSGPKLEHFLFSCRTLNMGIEQYVYFMLGYPPLENTGEPVASLMDTPPDWIGSITPDFPRWQIWLFEMGSKLWHNVPALRPALNKLQSMMMPAPAAPGDTPDHQVLFKGGCTVNVLNAYLENAFPNIDTEVAEWYPSTTIMHYQLSEKFDEALLQSAFAFSSDLQPHAGVTRDYPVIILDLAKDYRTGYYQFKDSDIYLPISPYHTDMTDEANWPKVKTWKQHLGSGPWWDTIYTNGGLKWLKENCTFVAPENRMALFENSLRETIASLKKQQPNSKIIIVDHSDIQPEDCFDVWSDLSKEITRCKTIVKNVIDDNPDIALVDIGAMVQSNADFVDGNAFHFKRSIAFSASHALLTEIQSGLSGATLDSTEKRAAQ